MLHGLEGLDREVKPLFFVSQKMRTFAPTKSPKKDEL